MVYVPWHKYGICRHWMLKQCRAGDACNYKHPAKGQEWHRVWDEAVERQTIDAANGIEPPVKPVWKKAKCEKRAKIRAEHEAKENEAGSAQHEPATKTLDGTQDIAVKDANANVVLVRRPAGARYEARRAPLPSARQIGQLPNVVVTDTEQPADEAEERFAHWSNNNPRKTCGGKGHLRADSASFEVELERHDPADAIPQGDSHEAMEMSHRELSFWEQGEEEYLRKEMEINKHGLNLSAQEVKQYKSAKVPVTDQEVSQERRGSAGVGDGQGESARSLRSDALTSGLNLTPHLRRAALQKGTEKQLPAVLRMGAVKRLSNGEVKHVGPHPSTMRVSAPYMSQAVLEKKLQPTTPHAQLDAQERSIAEAREDNIRLQGCRWLDDVRRALQLPIRTFTTACVYYHKFRLAHPGSLNGMDYGNAWADACAASLLTSCKVEDTLKKSRDILAAAYNAKVGPHDQLGVDDQLFEQPSRTVIGLERMVLEAGGFDFRSKYPHRSLVKILKMMPESVDDDRGPVSNIAWAVLTDLHRTFAPLKQTSSTMALASLELATHLVATGSSDNASAIQDAVLRFDIGAWSSTREEIMETILDALDLYTHHTQHTVLGSQYTLDDFLRIRLVFNKECTENNIPRYTTAPPSDRPANGNTLRVQNGHPTPVSPPQPGVQTQGQQGIANSTAPAGSEGPGTLRFIWNPQLATDETAEIQKYFVEEWEEYEEEIEIVPPPRAKSPPRERDRERDRPTGPPPPPSRSERSDRPRDEREYRDRERERERDRPRDREREIERERPSLRGPPPPRYDDRRYDDRRYDERREGRRYYDDRRRR